MPTKNVKTMSVVDDMGEEAETGNNSIWMESKVFYKRSRVERSSKNEVNTFYK